MDAYIGEIRAFAFNFQPQGWLLCDGTEYPMTSYQGLFSVLQNIYGGTAGRTFKVPDLRQKTALGAGSAPNLTPYSLAQTGGTAGVALTGDQMPAHSHNFYGAQLGANTATASEGVLANIPGTMEFKQYSSTATDAQFMGQLSLGGVGGDFPHENRQPFVAMGFYICFDGEYPTKPS